MLSLRSIALTALIAVGAASCAWIAGCATADNEVEAVPGRKVRDGGGTDDETTPGDDSGEGGDGGGGGGDTSTGCTAAANTCATAIDLGTIAVGGTKTESSALPTSSGDRWYTVKFGDLSNTKAHPRIVLTSTDPGMFFQVVKTCAGEGLSCGDEGGLATKVKEFEMAYKADPAAMPDDAAVPGEGDGGVFKPIVVGEGGVVLVRVFRSGGSGGCDFKLDVTN